ncbi:winged helix-turn-helix transcriptional regulator [Streptomyces sp. BR123]|uniref:ArsR/SmtB family transcription factor n=1 Tax=Streptomyces sp. BR123 TaxID=2749828 RepID=UPI0015C48805|nr:metalloregulator ArsR/SmtB family transcription factor [Streptomyces sp. BR123]NXY98099.1 winged helix-turn-helix transcriptional regulator [Streptomyces sp. BR123]
MISFELGVEDLADTRFAVSPLGETVLSLRVLRDPGVSALHLPWRRSVLGRLGALDTGLLMSLVADRLTLPDFLTPRPAAFESAFEEELAAVRRTPPGLVRRDLLAAHAPDPLPDVLRAAVDAPPARGDAPVVALRDRICELLHRYWEIAVQPVWPQLRLVAEADMTYRARQLARGGARLLFADMHPQLHWEDGGSRGVLRIHRTIGGYEAQASGRGLLLVPCVFAHKPAPPVSREEPLWLLYPSRGVATLWAPGPASGPGPGPAQAAGPAGSAGPEDPAGPGVAPALVPLLGAPRARLLGLLAEPLATVELARRLRVTPSAVSQHLRVLHGAGLVTRARHGRQVLYRRSTLGEQLATGCP